jgi:hypothetical protein
MSARCCPWLLPRGTTITCTLVHLYTCTLVQLLRRRLQLTATRHLACADRPADCERVPARGRPGASHRHPLGLHRWLAGRLGLTAALLAGPHCCTAGGACAAGLCVTTCLPSAPQPGLQSRPCPSQVMPRPHSLPDTTSGCWPAPHVCSRACPHMCAAGQARRSCTHRNSQQHQPQAGQPARSHLCVTLRDSSHPHLYTILCCP